MKQEDLDFKASLGYVARPDSKQKKKRKKERRLKSPLPSNLALCLTQSRD
jgi:hypothetical protein